DELQEFVQIESDVAGEPRRKRRREACLGQPPTTPSGDVGRLSRGPRARGGEALVHIWLVSEAATSLTRLRTSISPNPHARDGRLRNLLAAWVRRHRVIDTKHMTRL